ncbi:MAG: FHA domain-containing protein [Oligoflexia bacterium]|nr:FHA domain-containing protein [Oligoflexia bacterium]
MAKLNVFLNGTLQFSKDLDTDQEYVLGRGSQCDICLDHAEVSRQHAKLKFDGNNWNIEVLSRFGRLMVNGHPIESVSLTSGAQFTISPFEFKFDDKEVVDKTIRVEIPAQDPVSDDKTSLQQIAVKSVLLRLDGQGEPVEEITLGSGIIDAGRSRSCSIKIEDEKASRRQFTLTNNGTTFVLEDLDSPNGTFVNGIKVKTHALQSGDEIKIGKEIFRFELMNPEFENLPTTIGEPEDVPAKAPAMNQVSMGMDKTEVAVIKISPQYSPAAWNQNDVQNYSDHINEPVMSQKSALKNKNTRIKVIALVLIIGCIYVLTTNEEQPKPAPRTPAGQAAPASESANIQKLSPEQKRFLEDTYNLAMSLYTTGKYDLAALEINKIFQITPTYKDSKNIQALCQQALEIKKQQDEAERRKKDQEELQAKVSSVLDGCEKILSAKKYGQVESCVSQISDMDPENSRAQNLSMTARQAIEQMENSKDEQASRARRKSSALRTFENAKKAFNEKRYPAAINNFEQVANISFSDSDDIKQKAKTGIKVAKERMLEMSNHLMHEGKAALETKDYKNAISKLVKALALSPDNGDARLYFEKAERESHLELKNLYAEAVIEENLGNIESAKKKWRIILESGLVNDSYYPKAKSKLGKYER